MTTPRHARIKGRDFQTLMRKWFEPRSRWEVRAHALSGMQVDDLYLILDEKLPLSIECKNHVAMKLAEWWDQAEEQATDRIAYPILIHKRARHTGPGDQWVTMNVRTFTKIMEHRHAGF